MSSCARGHHSSPRECPLLTCSLCEAVRLLGFERPDLDTRLRSDRGFANISLESATCLFMHIRVFLRKQELYFFLFSTCVRCRI